MKRRQPKSNRAFTLLEVLVASVIVALAMYAFVRILRVSDQLLFRGRVDGKVATLVRCRLGDLKGRSLQQYVELVLRGNGGSAFAESGANTFVFKRGALGGNGTEGFPLVKGSGGAAGWDPFISVSGYPFSESYGTAKYLFEVPPVPGDAQGVAFEYSETLRLIFSGAPSDSAKVEVQYSVSWVDDFSQEAVKPVRQFDCVFYKSNVAADIAN